MSVREPKRVLDLEKGVGAYLLYELDHFGGDDDGRWNGGRDN